MVCACEARVVMFAFISFYIFLCITICGLFTKVTFVL